MDAAKTSVTSQVISKWFIIALQYTSCQVLDWCTWDRLKMENAFSVFLSYNSTSLFVTTISPAIVWCSQWSLFHGKLVAEPCRVAMSIFLGTHAADDNVLWQKHNFWSFLTWTLHKLKRCQDIQPLTSQWIQVIDDGLMFDVQVISTILCNLDVNDALRLAATSVLCCQRLIGPGSCMTGIQLGMEIGEVRMMMMLFQWCETCTRTTHTDSLSHRYCMILCRTDGG